MARELTSHKVNECNNAITVFAADEPGPGGACSDYRAEFEMRHEGQKRGQHFVFRFQNGPIADVGTNGITNEVLLAIMIDRLEGFQSGKFRNDKNQKALEYLIAAREALVQRTEERLARGVEGTHEK